MDVHHSAPALIPASAWLAGLHLSYTCGSPPLSWSALGLALALAWWGRRGATTLAAFFAALLLAAGQGLGEPPPLEAFAGKIVEVRGTAVGHADGEGEQVFLLRAETIRVGGRLQVVAADLLVVLGQEDREAGTSVDWGDRLVLRGLLLAPMSPRNGAPVWPGNFRLRVKSERLLTVEGKGGYLDRLAAGLRQRADQALRLWTGDRRAAGFLRCLLLGDRSQMPDDWARSLNAVGLGHALSVSGFHVSLLLVMGWVLTSYFPARFRTFRFLLLAAGLVFFLLLVGPRPAAFRAGIMGLVALVALVVERPAAALNSLALSAILLTFDRPQLIGDLGFQLSFLATFGIALSQLMIEEKQGSAGLRIFAALFGAELMTMFLLVPRTGLWHPLGFVFNTLAGPWLGALLFIGLFCLLAAAVAPPLWGIGSWLFELLCLPLDKLAEFVLPSHLVALPVAFSSVSLGALPLLFALLLRFPRSARWGILLLLTGAIVGGPARPDDRLEVIFLDVGQGDAAILRDGRDAVLIDGGGWRRGDPAARLLVPALSQLGIRLRAVALSHGDLDHCGGLLGLTSYWPIAELWASAATMEKGCGKEVRERIPVFRRLARGDALALGRWKIEVLWPENETREEGNEQSLVLLARAPGGSVLLTGDIGKTTETALLRAGAAGLEADVLKIGHHGSRTSSTTPFLAAVAPRWAVISAGAGNFFGHPAPEVLERLQRQGRIRVLRTDHHGLIRLGLPTDHRPWRLEHSDLATSATHR